jgi:DNA-binding response OmpR family regulator
MDTGADAAARHLTDAAATSSAGNDTERERTPDHAATDPSDGADESSRREAVARAAHELKTPLAVIKGAATTLLSGAQDWETATQQELLQLIDAQVDRLLAQVNTLLHAWRTDSSELATTSELPVADRHEAHARSNRSAGRAHERPVILIGGGDAHLARYLRANLEAHGYRLLVAPSLPQVSGLLDQEDPDLLLLDTGSPERSAMAALQRVREYAATPTIVLGAAEEAECVRALDLGAVDYLAKPFGLDELLARVRAALRNAARAQPTPTERTFRSGGLTIDFAQHQVWMVGCPVPLSRTEYKLLRTLAQNAGRVVSHELLLERVWGQGYGQEVEFLWVYVRRLRRKIEPDPRNPRYIVTIPGVGYRLAQL